jgi:hypothetical protein
MRSSSMVAAVIVLLASWALPRSQTSDPAAPTDKAADNSTPPQSDNAFFIVAEFTQSLNAKKLKAGDKVKAAVAQDVVSHGKIVIPAESRLIGHVTEACRRTQSNGESRVGIVFDRILLKYDRQLDFQGVIRSLEAPSLRRSRVDELDQMMAPGTAMARGSGSRSLSSASAAASSMSAADGSVVMNTAPGGNMGNSRGGGLNHSTGGERSRLERAASPMSIGMPFGVFGIKDVNLVPGPSDSTPGPVIVSLKHDVKLDYGTQVLIRAGNPHLGKP